VKVELKKERRRRRRKTAYTKGELNKLVDSALHPLFEDSPIFIAVDEAAHALIEQDLRESVLKFIRYSLPTLIQKLVESIEE
jgi:hypothetical protein